MPNPKQKPQQGPDPAVMDAIQKLAQTQLDPLQEVIFQNWMQANQLEESPDAPFDYRGLYQQTNGKVYAPGALSNKIGHQNAIQTLMQAQEQHDSASPMRAFEEAQGSSQTIDTSDLETQAAAGDQFFGGGSDPMGGGGSDPMGGF